MSPVRSLLGALALAAGTLVVAAVPASAPAGAVDQTKGEPGFCPDDTGVTVVVDFQELGGETIVRCNPTATAGTGLDALLGSGIQVEGVQRWGLAFICRVENRPSAVEELAVDGDPSYRERCIDTPPASGYWSYWHAGNNCAWKYSQWGVKNRAFVPGGFEGWSFSLNATADSNPEPRIAAVRPGTEGGPCVERQETAPTSDDPLEQQPGLSGSPTATPTPSTTTSATSGGSSRGALPAPKPPSSASGSPNLPADPARNVDFTGGEAAPDVRDVVKDQVNASDVAPWVATGVMVVLAVLALVTARRRRRVRDGG